MGFIYFVKSAFLDDDHSIDIDEDEYDGLISAKSVLEDALKYEELYEVVINNFREFEFFCMSQSLDVSMGLSRGVRGANESITEANRLTLNVFSSMKSYCEQVRGIFKGAPSGPEFIASARDKLNSGSLVSVGDMSGYFYLFYELRNFSQHCSFPIQAMVAKEGASGWVEVIYPGTRVEGFSGYLANRKSKEAEMAKRSIADRIGLSDDGRYLDVRAVCYEVFGGISNFHSSHRRIVLGDIAAARDLISRTIDKFYECVNDGVSSKRYVKVVKKMAGSDFEDSCFLMLDWDDARIESFKRNKFIVADFKRGG